MANDQQGRRLGAAEYLNATGAGKVEGEKTMIMRKSAQQMDEAQIKVCGILNNFFFLLIIIL